MHHSKAGKATVLIMLFCSNTGIGTTTNGFPLAFTETTIDADIVEYGQVYRAKIGFKNQTAKRVMLTSVRGSCGCVQAKTNRVEYQPNETGYIDFSYAAGNIGKVSYNVSIVTSEGQKAILPFSANVIRSFAWNIETTVFETHFDETPQPKEINLFYFGDDDISPEVKEVSVDSNSIVTRVLKNKWLETERVPVSAEKTSRPYFATIQVHPLKPAGEYREKTPRINVTLFKPNETKDLDIYIPIAFHTKPICRIYPNPIVKKLHSKAKGGEFTYQATVKIRSIDPSRKVEGTTVDPKETKHAKIERITMDEEGEFAIRIMFRFSNDEAGIKKGRLPVYLSVGGVEVKEEIGYMFVLAK